MIPARANRIQLAVVLLLLVTLHFYVRPRLWGPRVSPDFLLVGLMLFAMRSGPGASGSRRTRSRRPGSGRARWRTTSWPT